MSPNVAKRIPSRPASQRARSTSPADVTQTGQPGPEISRIPGGRSFRIPYRPMAWVWLPQTSMIVTGLPIRAAAAADVLQEPFCQKWIPVFLKVLHDPGSP